jgi:ribosomal protein S18 acetylase RimI-like enzyme
MTTSVRRAAADDAAILAEVAGATFALACPPDTTLVAIADFIATHFTREHFERYLADPARALFLAYVDDVPAGYTMVIFGDPDDQDVATAITIRPTSELSKLYVLPGHHGAGVAQALVTASIDEARKRGAAGMWLGVNHINERANRFYEKSGFARIGTKKFLVGDRFEDDFVRERSL